MQDEHFMRQWNEGHRSFSADLHQALNQIGRYRRTRQTDIGSSYGFLDKYAEPQSPSPALPPRAKASLRGLAATMFTVLLWAVVLMVATPAPGLAASLEASAPTCACTVLLPLA